MKSYRRYAIYYAPREGALLDAIETWLGRSTRPGITVTPVALPALAACGTDLATLTKDPRRYGCHATLKAPFRLAEDASAEALSDALSGYAAGKAPVRLDGLELSQIGRFFALTPLGDTEALGRFAFDVVSEFHRFAGPLSEAEIARRQPERLTSRQRELLTLWSYPYVAEEFRFHVTLTQKVSLDCSEIVRSELGRRIVPLLPERLVIEDLCLFGEVQNGDFELIERFPLAGIPR